MLKIARYLFSWTGNVTYADYYERAIMNGLLGTQRMPALDHHEFKSLENQHHQQHQHLAAAQGTGAEALLQLGTSTGNDMSVSR